MELVTNYIELHTPIDPFQKEIDDFLSSSWSPSFIKKVTGHIKRQDDRARYFKIGRQSGKTLHHQALIDDLAQQYQGSLLNGIQKQLTDYLAQKMDQEIMAGLGVSPVSFDTFQRPQITPSEFYREVMGEWVGGDTDGDYR